MIGSYSGPKPSPMLWKEFEAKAEALRLNATDFYQYLEDFVQLWNSTPKVPRITSWSWVEVTPVFKSQLINTHSAPIGKPTNFCQDLDKPRWYPGIHGRLKIIFDYKVGSHGVPLGPKGLGVHFGSGNGTRDMFENYGYSCYTEIWLEDFPKIWEAYQEIRGLMPERMTLEEFSICTVSKEDIPKHLFTAQPKVRALLEARLH